MSSLKQAHWTKKYQNNAHEAQVYKAAHTPSLFTHIPRMILFTLVVYDFGLKLMGKEHRQFFMSILNKYYDTEKDWKGEVCCGITLTFNILEGCVNISMPK